jgi:hypothetical protein
LLFLQTNAFQSRGLAMDMKYQAPPEGEFEIVNQSVHLD